MQFCNIHHADGSDCLSKLKIIGEDPFSDPPCAVCDCSGPTLIAECAACGSVFDICSACVVRLQI
jgi:hypothetical protein